VASGSFANDAAEILSACEAESPKSPLPQLPTAKSNPTNSALIEPLTEREQEVLRYLAAGYSNQEIADTLIISRYIVRAHLRTVYRKLAVHRRTQAVELARQHHLL
jgi:DNA-binding CsgD family transcriptional regulator